MHIQHLRIEQLRSFRSAKLALNTPSTAGLDCPNVNVLLGGNGLGKTSVLRAAALAALGPLLSGSSGYVPECLIRRPPGSQQALPPAVISAELLLHGGGTAEEGLPPRLRLSTTVEALGTAERLRWRCRPLAAGRQIEAIQFDARNSAFFMVGYGASRRAGSATGADEPGHTKARLPRYQRVSGLFEDHLGLIPLSGWLPACASTHKGRHRQIVRLMNALLPPACRMEAAPTGTGSDAEHLFRMNGTAQPLRTLSQGLRAYVAWIADLLFHLCRVAGGGARLQDIAGVVLLDEIDLHLHPAWQRVIVPTLSRALPNMQFILSTHSPLVVGSLQAGNLFVLDEEDGATVVKRLCERVRGRSAEQILLSPYFGLDSTRAPDVSNALRGLASRATAGDAAAAAQYLELLSGGMARDDMDALLAQPRAAAAKDA